MRYHDLIQNICVRYFKILKAEAKISQKEIAGFIGVSDCLISKWKNQQRSISAEYYKNILDFFAKQEFDLYFEKNRQLLIQDFDGIDPQISSEEFWNKLFHGELENKIIKLDFLLEHLALILKHRLTYDDLEIVSENRFVDEKWIRIICEKKCVDIYFSDVDTLVIREGKDSSVIDRQEIKQRKWMRSFYFEESAEMTGDQWIFLNQCDEKITEYLESKKI